MEHSYDIGSPWRARAFLAAAIAALELVVILVIAIVLVARPLSHHLRRVADRKAVAATPKHARAAKRSAPQHLLLSPPSYFPLASFPRYLLADFPVFLALAALLRDRPRARQVVLCGFAAIGAVAAVAYSRKVWVG